MIANAMPVLIRGSTPIDRGYLFIDGRPILGRNKTWEGIAVGITSSYIAGSSIGLLLSNHLLPALSIGAGIAALLGDITGAFIKRRLGINPGDPAPILDQLDFALAVTLYYYVFSIHDVISRPIYVLITLILIPVLHVLTNLIAYALNLKQSKL